MAADMSVKLFERYAYGKAALKKMGDVPENFRLYNAALQGNYPNYHGMQVEGAEFRSPKTGKYKGQLSILVKGTRRTAYVSNAEINAERDDTK